MEIKTNNDLLNYLDQIKVFASSDQSEHYPDETRQQIWKESEVQITFNRWFFPDRDIDEDILKKVLIEFPKSLTDLPF